MQLNKSHPLAKGLIACWVMNEGTGDKVFDLSSNGNHGTNNGADWVAGGLDLVATNSDYIDIQNESNFDFDRTDAFTICAGIESNGRPLYDPAIWCKSQTFDPWTGILFVADNAAGGDYIELILADNTFGNITKVRGSTDVLDGLYHNVAAINLGNDGSASDIELYVNGKLENMNILNDNLGANSVLTNVNPNIGARNATDLFFNGVIKYLFVYKRSLISYEIEWIHREPYAMFQSEIEPSLLYYETLVGWTGKINGITNPTKINGLAVANIGKVMRQ